MLRIVKLSGIDRAARTIYLNKTCYNGLFRVNSNGQFNTPIGNYKNPKILDKPVLKSASQALQNATIETSDFRNVIDLAEAGDFIYFDPPGIPPPFYFGGITKSHRGHHDFTILTTPIHTSL